MVNPGPNPANAAQPAGLLRAQEIQDRRKRYTSLTTPLKDFALWGCNLVSVADDLLRPCERLEQLTRVQNGANVVLEGISSVESYGDFRNSPGSELRDALKQFLLDSAEARSILTEAESLALLTQEIRASYHQVARRSRPTSSLVNQKPSPREKLCEKLLALGERVTDWSDSKEYLHERTLQLLYSVEMELDLLESAPKSSINPLEKIENLVWALCMDSLTVCVITGECVLEFAHEGRPFLPSDAPRKPGKGAPYRVNNSQRQNGQPL